MKTRHPSRALLSSAAILMGSFWLTAYQCYAGPDDSGGPPTAPPPIQKCSISFDTNFPSGAVLSLTKPANCPVKLTGQTSIPYAATLDIPMGTYVPYGSPYTGTVVNRLGYVYSSSTQAVWGQGSNGASFVTITGSYIAASGGFDNYSRGFDDFRNSFYWSGTDHTVTAKIVYLAGAPNNDVVAPSMVDPGTEYTVSATTNDPMQVGPLTWAWYVDDVYIGTTSTPETTLSSGGPNAFQQIKAVATDPNGLSTVGYATVRTAAGCADPQQLICQ